jgi:hypothetical protein
MNKKIKVFYDVTLDVIKMPEKTIQQKTEMSVCLFFSPFSGTSSAIVLYDVVYIVFASIGNLSSFIFIYP